MLCRQSARVELAGITNIVLNCWVKFASFLLEDNIRLQPDKLPIFRLIYTAAFRYGSQL